MEQPNGSNSYSKCVHMLTRGRGVEKSVLRYVHTKWMAPNKCCGIFFLCIGPAKYTKASPPARKMSLFFFIIITIILSCETIRSYTILHIYFSGIRNWGAGRTALSDRTECMRENLFNILQGISLVLWRMFLQESECAFKNPNVFNTEAS